MLTHSATDTQCQKLYRFQWKDSITFYNWRLDVMQSNSEVFSGSPTIEILDHAAITSFPYSWEYDKYPVGMYSAPISTINFNLSLLPNEFIQMLFDPFLETTVNVQTTTRETTRDIPITFQAGNLFRLYTDFGRGGGTIYEVFRGCQNSGFTNAYSNTDMNFPVDVIDYGRAVLESCSVALLKYTYQDATHNSAVTGVTMAIDLLIDEYSWTGWAGLPRWDIIAASQNIDSDGNASFYYIIMKEDIDDWINTCVNAVALSMMRKTGADIFTIGGTAGLPFAKYYKQHYEASPTADSYPYRKGDLITNHTLIAGVSSITNLFSFDASANDLNNYGFAGVLMEEYKDKSFWDLISDWIKNELKRGCFSACSGTTFTAATTDDYYLHIDNILLDSTVTLTDEFVISDSILPFANVLKKATASFVEKADNSKDIDSFETAETATRSGEDFTTSILFNSIPLLPELKMDNEIFQSFPYMTASWFGWIASVPHYLGVYYLDTPVTAPDSMILLPGVYPVRAWHIPIFVLGYNTSLNLLHSNDFTINAETEGSAYRLSDVDYYNYTHDTMVNWEDQTLKNEAIFEPLWNMIKFLNNCGGKGAVVANTLLNLFGHPSPWLLAGESHISQNLSELWFLPRQEITVDLSKYFHAAVDVASYCGQGWLTRASVELTTGVGQLEILGRRLGL